MELATSAKSLVTFARQRAEPQHPDCSGPASGEVRDFWVRDFGGEACQEDGDKWNYLTWWAQRLEIEGRYEVRAAVLHALVMTARAWDALQAARTADRMGD